MNAPTPPKITPSEGKQAVKQARSNSDIVVLSITFIVLLFMTSVYFIVSSIAESISSGRGGFSDAIIAGVSGLMIGGFVFLLLLGLGMFIVRMQRQIVLGNCLEVEYSDYAWLRDWSNSVAADFRLPQVEILITQDPYINAYAFGFIRPYNIVLHSGSIRYLTDDELRVVVVHEMAHIKYGHTGAMVYLQPFMAIPVVGAVAGWISGFWQRRAEYTADRLALTYTRNPELVKQSLIKVHVGPDAAKYMNDVARQWLQHKAERPMNHFAQTFSSHPFLVRRLSHIDKFARIFGISSV